MVSAPCLPLAEAKESSLYPLLSLVCVCVYHSRSLILFCMCRGGNSGLLQCGSLVLCRHKKSTPSPAQTECVWISNLKLKLKEREILHENITMCVNYILLILSFLNILVFWGTYPSSRV